MNWRGTTTVRDRIFACLPYLLPLVYGLTFGQFLFNQFPILQLILIPLSPLLFLYRIPFIGLIVFFALFMLVVRYGAHSVPQPPASCPADSASATH